MSNMTSAANKTFAEWVQENGYLEEVIQHYIEYRELRESVDRYIAQKQEPDEMLVGRMQEELGDVYMLYQSYHTRNGAMTFEEAEADIGQYADGSRPAPARPGADQDGSEGI